MNYFIRNSTNISTKKKINGKMRYYYNVGKTSFKDGDNKGRDSEIQGYTKLQDFLGQDEKDRYWRSQSSLKKLKNEEKNTTDKYGGYEAGSEGDYATRAVRLGEKRVKAVWDEYKNTPLGKITKATETINKGREAVANILDDISYKLRSYKKANY